MSLPSSGRRKGGRLIRTSGALKTKLAVCKEPRNETDIGYTINDGGDCGERTSVGQIISYSISLTSRGK